jgi:hypothetical protein
MDTKRNMWTLMTKVPLVPVDPEFLIFGVDAPQGALIKNIREHVPAQGINGICLRFQLDTDNLYYGITDAGCFRTDKSRMLIQLGCAPVFDLSAEVLVTECREFREVLDELRSLREAVRMSSNAPLGRAA